MHSFVADHMLTCQPFYSTAIIVVDISRLSYIVTFNRTSSRNPICGANVFGAASACESGTWACYSCFTKTIRHYFCRSSAEVSHPSTAFNNMSFMIATVTFAAQNDRVWFILCVSGNACLDLIIVLPLMPYNWRAFGLVLKVCCSNVVGLDVPLFVTTDQTINSLCPMMRS